MVDSHILAVRLLVPQERWGWEYVVPPPAAPSPLREYAPRWVEVPQPESLRRHRARTHGMPQVLAAALLLAALASAQAAAWGLSLWPIVGLCVLGPVAARCAIVGARYGTARREYESRFQREQSRFAHAVSQWQSAVAEHDRLEHARVRSTTLWYPLPLGRSTARVNVFGGTSAGWSSLLVTLGLSLLSAGTRLLVLDLSERGAASDLLNLASSVGYPARVDRVPADGVIDVQGLPPAQAGELVAEVLAATRGHQSDDMRLRAVDAELVEAVMARLAPPHTFERLAAGLAVVRRTFEADRPSCLSADEVRGLSRMTELIGSSSSAGEELRFLAATMRLLSEPPRSLSGPIWPDTGLRVIATADANARRKLLLDRFVYFRMLREIRERGGGDAMVVAGADHLTVDELESLARQADRAGIRLIVMCEHLRGDHTQLLGSAGSATVLMRLGNAQEATAAADFVGRGHRFVLSQLTEQVGRSLTDGTSSTAGDSTTTTVTDNYSPASSGSSDSRSRAATWSQTRSWSETGNTSDARTWTRAYEYSMEPTTFQSLPATAFVRVEPGSRGRRIVAGDCNPGIALLDRVATAPRGAAIHASC